MMMTTMTTKIDLLAYAVRLVGRAYEWDEPRVWRFLSQRESMEVVSDFLGLDDLAGTEKRTVLDAFRAGLQTRGLHTPPDKVPNKAGDELPPALIMALLREGWSFRQIGENYRAPVSSVHHRYQQAMGL